MTRAGTPVAILAESRLGALRLARRRGIPRAEVFWPESPAALAYIIRAGAQEIIVPESLWDHPQADALADELAAYLNPYPAHRGQPSNLPRLRRG